MGSPCIFTRRTLRRMIKIKHIAAIFAAVSILVGLVTSGRAQQATAEHVHGRAYLFYGLIAAIDWGMSLEPHWFSASYGLVFIFGQALAALAFAVGITST